VNVYNLFLSYSQLSFLHTYPLYAVHYKNRSQYREFLNKHAKKHVCMDFNLVVLDSVFKSSDIFIYFMSCIRQFDKFIIFEYVD